MLRRTNASGVPAVILWDQSNYQLPYSLKMLLPRNIRQRGQGFQTGCLGDNRLNRKMCQSAATPSFQPIFLPSA